MAHPMFHSISSAKKFGGEWQDYLPLHSWLDYTKAQIADCRHRLFLHNAWGIWFGELMLGVAWRRASDQKQIPTRVLLERHVEEDFRKIPTLDHCLGSLSRTPCLPNDTLVYKMEHGVFAHGGIPQDYQALATFFELPRRVIDDQRYQRVLLNTWGVWLATEHFGPTISRSDGSLLATQSAAETIIRATLQRETIPTMAESLDGILLDRSWMCRQALPLSEVLEVS